MGAGLTSIWTSVRANTSAGSRTAYAGTVRYEVHTAWYNYTRRDGTTYAEILLSRNGTKSGRYMILAYDVTPGVSCSAVQVRGLYIFK